MTVKVKVNLTPLRRFQGAISRKLLPPGSPIHDALKQWAARYRSYAQQQFVKNSRGGWKRLEESTRRRRRKARRGAIGARSFAILRDTNTLFSALDLRFTGKPGSIQEDIPFGIKVGFGGPVRYKKGKSRATIADIAEFHHTGAGNLPVRKIMPAKLPRSVLSGMSRDMERGIQRTINSATRGGSA